MDIEYLVIVIVGVVIIIAGKFLSGADKYEVFNIGTELALAALAAVMIRLYHIINPSEDSAGTMLNNLEKTHSKLCEETHQVIKNLDTCGSGAECHVDSTLIKIQCDTLSSHEKQMNAALDQISVILNSNTETGKLTYFFLIIAILICVMVMVCQKLRHRWGFDTIAGWSMLVLIDLLGLATHVGFAIFVEAH